MTISGNSTVAERSGRYRHTSDDAGAAGTQPTSRPKVLLVGDLVAMMSPGGGEVQLHETARALRGEDVDARLWRPWEDRFEHVDAVHLFGSTPSTAAIARAAREAGKPVVLSPITWFDPRAMWREAAPWPKRCERMARWWLQRSVGHRGSWRRRLYHSADALLPNSMAEASQLAKLFQLPWGRLHVVPNAADARFADADPQPFVDRYGVSDFVLYAGRIEPRKNQATFLRAMAGEDVPIVVLGDAVPRHMAYYDECRRVAGANVTFVDRLQHDDPLLESAYAAARCLALCSWFETPGLVALEAALSGTPLVLGSRGSAREYFGPMATYVDPEDEGEIRGAVLAAHGQEPSAALAELVRTQFSWQATAQATRKVYDEILG
jgi:glycosyltransferase involved in cell wall biosynthesis